MWSARCSAVGGLTVHRLCHPHPEAGTPSNIGLVTLLVADVHLLKQAFTLTLTVRVGVWSMYMPMPACLGLPVHCAGDAAEQRCWWLWS